MVKWDIGGFGRQFATARLLSTAACVSILSIGNLPAQQLEDSEMPRAVARYHAALLERPVRGTVFERFCDGWLEQGTAVELENFLRQRVEADEDAGLADDLLLTWFFSRQGDDDEARKVLEAGLQGMGREAPVSIAALGWHEKAKIAMRLSDLDGAGQDLAKAAELLGDVGDGAKTAEVDAKLVRDVSLLRGKLLARLGERDEALKVWTKLAEQFPEDGDLRLDVIDLQAEAGLYDQALEGVAQLIDGGGDAYENALLQLRRVELLQSADRSDEAVSGLVKILMSTGQGSWIERETLARFERHFQSRDNFSGLAKALAERVEAEPQRLALLMAQARVLAELGDDDEALRAWADVLRLTPGQRHVRERYVAALSDMGRRAEAVAQLQRLIDLHADDAELYVRLADLQWRNGDAEAAQESVAKFVEVAGASEVNFVRAIRMLGQYRRTKAVEEMYRRWLQLMPESVAAVDGFATFLHREGRREEAVERWKNLVENAKTSELLFVAGRLLANSEGRAAYDILVGREKELGSNFSYLGKLAEAALAAGDDLSKEALPLARKRLSLANDDMAFSDAIGLAATAARRADADRSTEQDLLIELSGKAATERSTVDTCLLVELLRRAMRAAETEALLAELIEGESENGKGKSGAEAVAVNWARLQLVRWYEGQEQFRKAAGILQDVVESKEQGAQGGDAAALQSLANLTRRAGDLEAARHWLAEWKKAVPGSAQPWMLEASVLEEDGKYDAALKILKDVVRRFDDVDAVSLRLVDMYQKMGRIAEAEGVVWQLYSKEEKPDRRLGWARRLAQLAAEADESAGVSPGRGQGGRVDDLIEKFSERQRSNRRSLSPLRSLAVVYAVVNNSDEQRRILQQAVALEPENVGLLHELAGLAEEDGQTEDALRWLDQARRHDTTSRTVERLARLHLAIGHFEKAADLLREADLTKGALDLAASEEMAATLMAIGEWPRAVDLLQPLVEDIALASDYRLHYLYAVGLEESERIGEAAGAFLRCAQIEQELPDARRTGATAFPVTVEGEEDLSFLPQEAREIRRLSERGMDAFMYRWGVPRGWMYGASSAFQGSAGNADVALYLERLIPQSVDEAQWWARTHLATLAMNAEGDISNEGRGWWQALRANGFGEVLLNVLAGVGKQMKGEPEVGEILNERYAEDFLYQASQLDYQGGEIAREGREKVLRAMKVLEAHQRGDLAILAGLRVASRLRIALPEEAEVVQRETVRLLEAWQQPLHAVIFDEWIKSVLRRLEGFDGGPQTFAEAELAAVKKRMLGWRPFANDLENSERFWRVMAVLSRVADSGAMMAKLEEFLRIQALAEPIRADKTDIHSLIYANRMARMMYYGDDRRDNTELLHTPGYPPGFFAALRSFMVDESGKRSMNDHWATFVADVEDDVLAACLAKILEFPGELSIRLVRLRTGGDEGVASAYVLGVEAEQAGDWPKALEYFEKLRERAEAVLSGQEDDEQAARIRWLADSSIISLGVEARRGKEVHEAGKAALMRLVKESNPTLEVSLVVVVGVGQYQLESEMQAELLRHQGAVMKATGQQSQSRSSSSVRWNSYRHGSGPGAAGPLIARINRLAESGKPDAVVRLVADQLPTVAQARLNAWPDGQVRPSVRSSDPPLEAIKTMGLQDKLVAEVRTRLRAEDARGAGGGSGNFVRWARLGALCLELNRYQNAAEIFRSLRKARPQDHLIRLRLVEALCGIEDGSAEALAELRILAGGDETEDEELLNELVGGLLGASSEVHLRLGVVEMVMAYLETEGVEGEGEMLWEHMRNVLASPMQDNQMNLSALAVRGHRPEESSVESRPSVVRRERLYKRLCLVALNDPELAAEGFAGLYMLHDLGMESDTDLLKEARKALGLMSDAVFVTSSARVDSNGVRGLVFESVGPQDPFASPRETQATELANSLGPIQVLVAEAARQEKPEWIYDEVLPMLQSRGEQGVSVHVATKAWADLWFCEGTDFSKAVAALRKVPGVGDSKLFWKHLDQVQRERTGIDFDFGEELLASLGDKERREMAIQRLGDYLDGLFEQGGDEVVTGYLRRLFAEVSKQLLANQNREPKDWLWRSMSPFDAPSVRSGTVFGVVAQKPLLAMSTLRALSETEGLELWPVEEFARGGGWDFSRGSRDDRADFLQQVATFDTLLDLPLLVATVDEEEEPDDSSFDPGRNYRKIMISGRVFRGEPVERNRTLLGSAINNAARGSREDLGVILSRVRESTTATPFGQRLVAALIPKSALGTTVAEKRARPGDLVEIFVEAREEIESLPEDKRWAMARLAMDLLTDERLSREPEHVEMIRWLAAEAGDSRLEFLDQLVAMKSFADLGMSQSTAISKLKELLPFALVVDPGRSRLAYENVLQLADLNKKSVDPVDPFGGERNTMTALEPKETIFRLPLHFVEALALTELSLRKDPRRALRSGYFDQMANALEQQLPSAGDADQLLAARLEWLKNVLLRLDAVGGAAAAKGVWTTQLMSVFERANAGGEPLAVALIEWLNKSGELLSGELREEALTAAWLLRDRAQRKSKSTGITDENFSPEVKAAERRVIDALNDEETPFEVRMGLCDFWLKLAGKNLRPQSIVAAARRVLADCWQVKPSSEPRWIWSWVVQEVHAAASEGEPGNVAVPDWWQEKAGAMAEHLRGRYFDDQKIEVVAATPSLSRPGRGASVAQQRRQQRERLLEERQQVVPSLFALLVDLGREKPVMECLHNYPDLLNPVDDIWLMLVRKGLFDAASELLGQRRSDLGRRRPSEHLDARLAEQMVGYLETLEVEEDRLLATLLLYGLRDPSGTADGRATAGTIAAEIGGTPGPAKIRDGYPAYWQPWEQRLLSLAEMMEQRIAAASPKGEELSETLRFQILSVLSEYPPALTSAKTFVSETLRAMNLTRLERISDSTRRQELFGVLHRIVGAEVKAGDFRRWFRLRKEVWSVPGKNKWMDGVGRQLDQVVDGLQQGVEKGDLEPDVLVAFRREHALTAARSVVAGEGAMLGWRQSEGGVEDLGHQLSDLTLAVDINGSAQDFLDWFATLEKEEGEAGTLLREMTWLHWERIRHYVTVNRMVSDSLRRDSDQGRVSEDWPVDLPVQFEVAAENTTVSEGGVIRGDVLLSRFLATTALQEWGSADWFTDSMVTLLGMLAQRSNRAGFETARKVYRHAIELQRDWSLGKSPEELKKLKWTFENGWSYPASLVDALISSGDDLRVLDLGLELLDDAEEAGEVLAIHSWSENYRHSDRLTALLTSEGIRFELERPLQRSVERLGEVVEERTPDTQAKIFWELNACLDTVERGTLDKLVSKKMAMAAAGAAPKYWQELAMALAFADHVGGQAAVLKVDWQGHYLAILKDEALPPSRRFSLLQHWLAKSGGNVEVDAAVLLTGMELAIRLAERDGSVHGYVLAMLVRRFVRDIDREGAHADEWLRSAKRMLATWSKITEAENEVEEAENGRSAPIFSPAIDAVLAMRELAHHAGDKAAVAEIDKRFGVQLIKNSRMLAHHVRFGEFAQALKLVTRNQSWMSAPYFLGDIKREYVRMHFSEELAARTDEFLPKINDEGTRYMIAGLLAVTPDPSSSERDVLGTFPSRAERMREHAKGFASVKFANKESEIRALAEATLTADGALALREELRAAATLIDKNEVAEARTSLELEEDVRILVGACLADVLVGDGGDGATNFSEVVVRLGERNDRKKAEDYARDHLFRMLRDRLRGGLENLSEQERRWWSDVCMVTAPNAMSWAETDFARRLAVATTLLRATTSDKSPMDAAENPLVWRLGRYRSSFFPDLRYLLFDPIMEPDGPASWSAQERLSLVDSLLEDDVLKKVFGNSKELYGEMILSGWIGEEELIANAERWSEALPRGGWAMAEMAEFACRRNDLAAAESWMKRAIGWGDLHARRGDEAVLRHKRWRFDLLSAGLAIRKGKLDEAKAILPRLSPVALEPVLDPLAPADRQSAHELPGLRRLLEVAEDNLAAGKSAPQ